HRSEPVDATAAREAQQESLDLVVAVMSEEEMQDAMHPDCLEQQPVACLARSGGDAAGGLVATPQENMMLDAGCGKAGLTLLRCRARLRTQAMIDGECHDAAAPPARPVGGQQAKTQAVRAARYRDGGHGAGLERADRCHQTVELVPPDGSRGARAGAAD